MNLMLILYSRFFKYLLKIYTIIKIYNRDRNKSKFEKSLSVDNVLIRKKLDREYRLYLNHLM